MSADSFEPILDCRDVQRSFGAVRALRGASLRVEAGTVHGLVGHNGAGKSTMAKIVSGLLEPDAGEVLFGGQAIQGCDRRDAIKRGIWAVPQELTVLPEMSVADNVSVGGEPRRGFLVSRRELRRRAEDALGQLGLDHISVDTPVQELRPSEKRVVMIAMAVCRECRFLILDEPTASLGVDEAQPLLELVESLPRSGITVLYVSHRLDEIERLCDRVTVMRDGVDLEVLGRGEFNAHDLVGRMVEELPPGPQRVPQAAGGEVAVRVRGLRGVSLRGLDVDIAAGRVTGFTGLVGSGADELLEIIAGGMRARHGTVEVLGEVVSPRTPAEALRAGIGFLPGSRASSAMTDLTIRDNVLASSLERLSVWGFLPPGRERRAATGFVDGFGLAKRVERPLGKLSGGNQQKVLLARLMAAEVDVLVVNDPTAGVDVKARADLHALLRELADGGKTVIVRCSEPDELLDLADEIHVLAGGRLSRSFAGAAVDLEQLLEASATSGAELQSATTQPA